MKKIFFLIIWILTFQTQSLADNIRYFQIEGMSIGDSALDYFSESQLENNEQGWHNYTYNEFSTSYMPGKGFYNWFLVTYKNDDNNFIIEGLVGGLEKSNYDNKECNNKLDVTALNISELFKNTKRSKKKLYKVEYNSRKVFQEANQSGKSTATSISFDFNDKGKIILSCYDMDKATNQIDSPIKDINQFDSFRIDIRSKVLKNYLEKI